MRVSRGESTIDGRGRQSILADALEAVFAAVYKDAGLASARAVVRRLIRPRLALTDPLAGNAKGRLQETIQAAEGVTPFYRVVERSGPVHAAVFTVEVLAGERVLGRGQGLGKRQAEQRAAEQALAGQAWPPDPDRHQSDARPSPRPTPETSVRLRRLELHGFKTFAARATLEFAPGITAVVGPNGSGKCNLAEAVRWVLGEQSARQLRGRRSEDVIFAGGQQRAPQGMAEVTLILEDGEGRLPAGMAEAAVGRRLYRTGESEYYVNRARVRLRDVVDLLARSGVGQQGHTVIGQGQVDLALSLRPEERRGLFEDAAGVPALPAQAGRGRGPPGRGAHQRHPHRGPDRRAGAAPGPAAAPGPPGPGGGPPAPALAGGPPGLAGAPALGAPAGPGARSRPWKGTWPGPASAPRARSPPRASRSAPPAWPCSPWRETWPAREAARETAREALATARRELAVHRERARRRAGRGRPGGRAESAWKGAPRRPRPPAGRGRAGLQRAGAAVERARKTPPPWPSSSPPARDGRRGRSRGGALPAGGPAHRRGDAAAGGGPR